MVRLCVHLNASEGTVFHEEKMIGGVLCWRSTPDGAWNIYSLQALSAKIVEQKLEIAKLRYLMEP